MGVPGFYRWIIKTPHNNKYLIIPINDIQNIEIVDLNNTLNNIDYIHLDLNGLIHPVCNKTILENNNITDTNELEELIINNVLDYTKQIISQVNPQKGFYIGVDGVAPVAKIKQQRIRRHKSISDKKLFDNIKTKHNIPIPNYWNTNAITPGTEFMEKLHNKLLEFIESFENLHIIYSSYLTFGEGEHKIIEFIKNNKDYSHVIYGLDADLIFLSLVTNSDKIFLLRESNEINYDNNKTLNYLNINVFRKIIIEIMKDYIDKEINNINLNEISENIKNKLNNIQLINDFIFICYLLGNDFIPHIPSLDIYENGVEILIINYTKILVELYIIDNNIYNLINDNKINDLFFNKFMYKLYMNEETTLQSNYYNKKIKKCYDTDPYKQELFKIDNLQFKIYDPIQLGSDCQYNWRIRYYKHYWNLNPNEIEEFSKELVKQYLIGLKWITLYYFDKCPSWEWYYPYDYPPFISDIYTYINNFDFNNYEFNLGKPLKPFVQLLIVLPYSSNYLLPEKLRKLIIDEKSSIKSLYPITFDQDFINKKKYWMGIPKLPKLDINKIKYYFHKYKDEIFEIDNKRNNFIKAIEII